MRTNLGNWAQSLKVAARQTLGEDTSSAIEAILLGPTGKLPLAHLVARSLLPTERNMSAPEREKETLDLTLWSALALERDPPDPPAGERALTGEPTGPAIEVWTEIELASLHAAWSLGPAWRSRSELAAKWLVDEIQPDNATNHPWGAHVFAHLAHTTGDASFELYAQTLLHNCMVTSGKPDEFSAMILLHSARTLAAERD